MTGPSFSFQRVQAVRVAFVELVGPYENWGKGLMELKQWLDANRVQTAGQPIGLFYDTPTLTPHERLRSEACLPIAGEVQPEGRFKVKELPQAPEAAVIKEYPVPEYYTKLYGPFFEAVMRSGYRFDGPTRETFREPNDGLMPGKGVMVQQPVRKA